ncbi:MAG: hypothetical protein M3O86_00380, partial [Actinomycetota bacterium]|nr:hypothetical protein [Actinomycetota bacterium]
MTQKGPSPVRLVPPLDVAPPPDHPVGLGEDSGPHPLLRAVVGLLVGVAAGALAAALTPRPERA